MSTHNKILFLDVDGVLTTSGHQRQFGHNSLNPQALQLLAGIIRRTGAKIVLTTTWRSDPNSRAALLAALTAAGILENLTGSTPEIALHARDQEIRDWLASNPTTRFAILDDDPSAGRDELKHSFFEISSIVGLQESDTEKIVQHLNAKS